MDKSIKEIHEALINGEVTSDELVEEALRKSHEVEDKYNAFVTILDEAEAKEVNSSFVSGIPFGVKDNYSTKDVLSTGSSNTLKNYVPFYTATVVQKLLDAGAIMVNKTALDEFGMGGSGTTCHTGPVLNPWDKTRMCAGSSAGSACAVASGVYPFALGSDTGDSIRKPAAYCGIVGYKPTYGMLSRYGLFPFASSLDHCGVLTRSVKDAAIVNTGVSRWHNYYMEGLDWLVKNVGIDGLYIDDLAFDRMSMKRVRKILNRTNPGAMIDLHSANQFNEKDGFANSFVNHHFQFFGCIWLC